MKNYVSVSLVGKKFERMFSAAEAVSCDHFGSEIFAKQPLVNGTLKCDHIKRLITLTSD